MTLLSLCAILLAGEAVHFDASTTPRFSAAQVHGTAGETREGLVKWAATPEGRKLIAFFSAPEFAVRVTEDGREAGAGRAPEPGMATFLALQDHAKVKEFAVILNPRYFLLPQGMQPLINEPASAADLMAIAWAGEMLHVYFYARGINLPHHVRADFQDEWRAVANELGMGLVTHDDER